MFKVEEQLEYLARRWSKRQGDKDLDEVQLQMLWEAVQQSASTVVITDTHGTIEFVNPRFTSLTGFSLEEAVGKNPRIIKSGLTPSSTYVAMWDAINSGQDWHGEVINRRKDGSLYWGSLHISPIFDASGEITAFLGIEEDVTEEKTLRENLSKANLELNRLNEEIKQYTAMLSHAFGRHLLRSWEH